MNLNNEDIIISFSTPEYNTEVDLTKPNSGNLNKRKKSFIVGYIQQMNLSQQRQITKLFEIDNKEYEMVASKVITRLQINRVLLDGPSVLKYVAYALYGEDDIRYDGQGDPEKTPDHTTPPNKQSIYNPGYAALIERVADDMGFSDYLRGSRMSDSRYVDNSGWGDTPEREIPGTSDLWLNLTSELFEKPIGIYLDVYQKGAGANKHKYGGVFLENCMIANHTISTQANNRLITENMTIEVGMPIPCIGYGGDDIARLEYQKQHERLRDNDRHSVLNTEHDNQFA